MSISATFNTDVRSYLYSLSHITFVSIDSACMLEMLASSEISYELLY